MKIQRLVLLVVWSAKLAASQSDVPLPTDISQYPTCVQNAQCLEYAASIYCAQDPYIGCACDRQVVPFFLFLYYCASAFCSTTTEVTNAVDLADGECKSYGYDVTSKLQEALATPTFTFVMPSVTLTGFPSPTFTFPTDIIQSSDPSVTSNPDTTSTTNTKTTSTSTTSESSGSSGLSTGAIIGIVVGGVAVIAIIAGLIVFCMRHRAKQRRVQAMTAPPPPPAPTGLPPPMAQYTSPPPPQGYSPYPAPVYPPQQQPFMQQQQQPLMQGYQELEQPENGYYAPPKIDAEVMQSIPPTTTTTPAPLPPNQQGQYFQELPAQHMPVQVGPGVAQEGHVYVEMPGNNRR